MKIFTDFTTKVDGNMKDIENQKQFLLKNNLGSKKPVLMKQVHGNIVSIVDDKYELQECDGIITDQKNFALFVLVADCQPILMYDEINQIVAAIHAGREGVFGNILKEAVTLFQNKFKSELKDIKVIIGPSAKKCCYEVGAVSNKYIDYVEEKFGKEFIYGKNIDLQGIAIKQLITFGILGKNIITNNICTIESPEYFSYRNGNNGNRHRFAGVITFH